MLDPKLIEQWIAAGLPCEHVTVEGDGHHFQAVIVCREFAGLNRVKRQRLVNDALRELLVEKIHALSIRALAPGEQVSL